MGDTAALAEAEQRIAELHAENERLILEARLTFDATSERERATTRASITPPLATTPERAMPGRGSVSSALRKR